MIWNPFALLSDREQTLETSGIENCTGPLFPAEALVLKWLCVDHVFYVNATERMSHIKTPLSITVVFFMAFCETWLRLFLPTLKHLKCYFLQ